MLALALVGRFPSRAPVPRRAQSRPSTPRALNAALFSAVEERDRPRVRHLLAWGADPNAATEYGATILGAAAAAGSTALVDDLLAAGARINHCPPKSEPVLAYIAINGRREMFTFLLACGADPNGRDHEGRSALMLLAGKWCPEDQVVEERAGLLLTHGATVDARDHHGATVTTMAATGGRSEIVPRLDAVAQRHGQHLPAAAVNGADAPGGLTPLMRAAERGDARRVAALLEQGAVVNAKTDRDSIDDGPTALNFAAWGGHTAVVRLLLDHGASPDATVPTEHETALFTAAEAGRTGMVRALLKAGANPNATDRAGASPLLVAGNVAVARLLVARGAHVNAGSTPSFFGTNWPVGGETALMRAAGDAKALPTVRFLLSAGADVNARDELEGTALSRARDAHLPVTERLLIAAGARH
jgi:ankyrin repeat protein